MWRVERRLAGSEASCSATDSTPVEVMGALPGGPLGGTAIGPKSRPVSFGGPKVLCVWRSAQWSYRLGSRQMGTVGVMPLMLWWWCGQLGNF
jgi:hypothetical protein